jgi:hypothetical protein
VQLLAGACALANTLVSLEAQARFFPAVSDYRST